MEESQSAHSGKTFFSFWVSQNFHLIISFFLFGELIFQFFFGFGCFSKQWKIKASSLRAAIGD